VATGVRLSDRLSNCIIAKFALLFKTVAISMLNNLVSIGLPAYYQNIVNRNDFMTFIEV
jgi:hypothetical protein